VLGHPYRPADLLSPHEAVAGRFCAGSRSFLPGRRGPLRRISRLRPRGRPATVKAPGLKPSRQFAPNGDPIDHPVTAARLKDGRLLVLQETLGAAEFPYGGIYDPRSGTWRSIARPAVPAVDLSDGPWLVPLPSGRVLLVSSDDNGGASSEYNPQNDAWTGDSNCPACGRSATTRPTSRFARSRQTRPDRFWPLPGSRTSRRPAPRGTTGRWSIGAPPRSTRRGGDNRAPRARSLRHARAPALRALPSRTRRPGRRQLYEAPLASAGRNLRSHHEPLAADQLTSAPTRLACPRAAGRRRPRRQRRDQPPRSRRAVHGASLSKAHCAATYVRWSRRRDAGVATRYLGLLTRFRALKRVLVWHGAGFFCL
jgi:hypothetical protein